MSWLRRSEAKLTLTLHIQPGAKKTEIAGQYADALKIRLAAPPVDGKANTALIDYLARWLDLPKSCITLKSGQASRRKIIEISSPSAHALLCLEHLRD